MGKHTPGPWRITNYGEKFIHIEGGMNGICRIPHEGKSIEENEANARLIASAPDLLIERDRLKAVNAELLEALKEADIDLNSNQIETARKRIKEAIAKATS